MKKTSTDAMIDSLVWTLGPDVSLRQQHVYRESLRALVRLAKAEQMQEIRASVERLSGTPTARAARKHTRAILSAQRLGSSEAAQRRLEFDQS